MLIIPTYKRYIAAESAAAIIGAAGAIGGSAVSGVAQSSLNKKTREFNKEEAEKQRQWNENMAEKQNAWNYELWLKSLAYDTPENKVKRLRDAGLNPLYYGLDGNSASAPTAAQPLGYDRASADNVPNPFEGVGRAFTDAASTIMQGKLASKELELKNAQIDKLNEDAKGVRLDNEWKDKTMDARSEAETLRNSMTKEQIKEVTSRIKVNEEEVKKKIAETKNEEEKTGLIIAQKMLTNAQANEIISLLPYKKLLMSAQTEAQKASAAASFAKAAIDEKLLEQGYVEKTIDDLVASTKQKIEVTNTSELNSAITAWKQSVRNGTVFNPEDYSDDVSKFVAQLANGFFGVVSTVSEAVGGGLSGFFK